MLLECMTQHMVTTDLQALQIQQPCVSNFDWRGMGAARVGVTAHQVKSPHSSCFLLC